MILARLTIPNPDTIRYIVSGCPSDNTRTLLTHTLFINKRALLVTFEQCPVFSPLHPKRKHTTTYPHIVLRQFNTSLCTIPKSFHKIPSLPFPSKHIQQYNYLQFPTPQLILANCVVINQFCSRFIQIRQSLHRSTRTSPL